MATYNTPNTGAQMPIWQQQQPVQFPYGNNNMLLSNTPYDNYMGNRMNINTQSLSQNQFLKCRPVSSKDEARAYQIDLDGSLWVFTDIGNNKIYTKQVNNDGTATFKTYTFTQDENPYNGPNDYVTRDQFNKVVQTLMAAIRPTNSQEPVSTPAQSNEKQTALANF